jgi:hypothetical protein
VGEGTTMTAADNLHPAQFRMMHPKELGHIQSRDYSGSIRDIQFMPGGESDTRVKAIMETAKSSGIKEPIDVRTSGGGQTYLHDGHHRYLAATRLGIPLPVKGMN